MNKNLFDVINSRMFSVFSHEDRRSNYDLLNQIYDIYNSYDGGLSLDKDELSDLLTEYIKSREFDAFDDEEGQPIERSAREKALYKIRQFKKTGWIEEDTDNGFDVTYSISDNGLRLLETFKELIENENKPIEYTGYFNLIYSMLKDFDYHNTKGVMEQVFLNTRRLFNSLRGISSSIKRYIEHLIKKEGITPDEVLTLLLEKYQNQVILKVFNNLKGKDNPSKYTSEILDKLKEFRFDNLDRLVNNYLQNSDEGRVTQEEYIAIEQELKDKLDDAITKFEQVDEFVELIDSRNTKFHNSAVAKLKFLLNSRNDIDGLITKSLRNLKNVPENADFEDIIPIYYSDNIDEKSTYSRTFKERPTIFRSEIPEISLEEIERQKIELFKDSEYSKNGINKFICDLLKDKDKVDIRDLEINDFETLAKLVVSEIYSEYKDVDYKLTLLDDTFVCQGYKVQAFIIERTGK